MSAALDRLVAAVASHEPRVRTAPVKAAVAVILRDTSAGPELLLIQRARRPGRRWSGDMALPGGLGEGDESTVKTAIRETAEEVGLALGAPVGRLSDRTTLTPRGWTKMTMTPWVFRVEQPGPLRLEPAEVADAVWVSVDALSRRRRWRLRRVGLVVAPFPEVRVQGRRVWGLTLSVLDELCRLRR